MLRVCRGPCHHLCDRVQASRCTEHRGGELGPGRPCGHAHISLGLQQGSGGAWGWHPGPGPPSDLPRTRQRVGLCWEEPAQGSGSCALVLVLAQSSRPPGSTSNPTGLLKRLPHEALLHASRNFHSSEKGRPLPTPTTPNQPRALLFLEAICSQSSHPGPKCARTATLQAHTSQGGGPPSFRANTRASRRLELFHQRVRAPAGGQEAGSPQPGGLSPGTGHCHLQSAPGNVPGTSQPRHSG